MLIYRHPMAVIVIRIRKLLFNYESNAKSIGDNEIVIDGGGQFADKMYNTVFEMILYE